MSALAFYLSLPFLIMCSEIGIVLVILGPVVADTLWGPISLAGRDYRFMTLYLICLGGLWPITVLAGICKNVRGKVPDREYNKLFSEM